MVKGQAITAVVAVLAGVVVALEQIAPGERNIFVGHTHVVAQADYRRQGKVGIDKLAVMLNSLSLTLDNENNGPAPARYVERFIGGV